MEPQFNYNRSFDQHKLDILLGASWQEELLSGSSIYASNYSDEALLFTTTGASTLSASEKYEFYRYQSIFGRVNYQYKGRYLLNLTGRRDGSSRFGPGRRFANFGALGAAWIFTEEAFVKDHLSVLTFGKVRGSYGLTGNDKIGNYRFMDTYGSVRYPYQGISGLAPTRLFNPDYSWESNKKLEFALDLGFFNDRILLSSGWFRNRSGNQLLQYTLPVQTGFSGITKNLPAHIENSGWEFELNSINMQGIFRWNTSFNLTLARNKLLDFPNLEISSYASRYAIGESLNIAKVYPYQGVDQETGLWKVDLAAGRIIIQDLDPKFYGGFNNSFQYKGLQLDVFFQFVKKEARNFVSSLPAVAGIRNFNMPVALQERWQVIENRTEIQRFGTVAPSTTARSNYFLSEGVFVDASFIRLKNMALSYQIPGRWVDNAVIQKARVYMQGQNLFTITNYEGNDPEVTVMTSLPPLRTMTFGIQISF
jgi:TonB-linked SusC/RagA family outer membrane protein